MRPPTSSSGLPTARASTSAKMWRSPEDTACEYCAMTSASSQVIPRSSSAAMADRDPRIFRRGL
jgi:hypothetical protein